MESLDSLLRFALSFKRKHFFSLSHVCRRLLNGAQSEYQIFRTETVLAQDEKSLSTCLVLLSVSDTHWLLGWNSGSNVPCYEVVEGAVDSKYRIEIVTNR